MKLAVFASGNGSNLQAILDACAGGAIPARVVVVVTNRRGAFALERARGAGVPALYLPLASFRAAGGTRDDYEADLAEKIAPWSPDLLVLAGWMHVFGAPFLDRFPMRVVNLHPALPGELPGVDAIARAWGEAREGRRAETGVMVHRVVPEVDAGPVLAVERVPILPTDALADLEARVHAVEHRLLVGALASLCRSPS